MIQPDGSFVIEVLSGDIKGTKMITTLTERIGFDGTPNGATTVKTKLILETNWWISAALFFVGTGEIQKAIGDGLYNIGEYVKVKYPNDLTKPTKPLEAAMKLDPAKEVLKPKSPEKTKTESKSTIQTNTMTDVQTHSQLYRINTSCEMLYAMSASEYPNGERLHSLSITGVVSKYQTDFGPWLETFADDKKLRTFTNQGFSPEFLAVFANKVMLEYSINPDLKHLALLALDSKTQTSNVNKIFEEDNCMEYYVSRKGTQNTQLSSTKSPQEITVKTDKKFYNDGNIITVSGQVMEILSIPGSLRVIAPNGDVVVIEQIDIDSDNTFSVEITAGGNLWRSAGTYTIQVSYGTTTQNMATTTSTFEFGGSSGGKPSTTIDVDGTDFLLSYTITEGKVLSITPVIVANSLIIAIETTNNGQLTVTLPRALIDAILSNGQDDRFFVLVDNKEQYFDETKTSTDRTLTIVFEKSAKKIEVIGTHLAS